MLDPSSKMDLDFWDCFGREKTSYNRRNTVSKRVLAERQILQALICVYTVCSSFCPTVMVIYLISKYSLHSFDYGTLNNTITSTTKSLKFLRKPLET